MEFGQEAGLLAGFDVQLDHRPTGNRGRLDETGYRWFSLDGHTDDVGRGGVRRSCDQWHFAQRPGGKATCWL